MPKAAARSNASARLASKKWKWLPTWIGRSPVLVTLTRALLRPALSSISPAGVTISPARGVASASFAPGRMGWWTVISLAPSGNIASTWITEIRSATPGITSSVVRSSAP